MDLSRCGFSRNDIVALGHISSFVDFSSMIYLSFDLNSLIFSATSTNSINISCIILVIAGVLRRLKWYFNLKRVLVKSKRFLPSLSRYSSTHHLKYEYQWVTSKLSYQTLMDYKDKMMQNFTHRGKASTRQSMLAMSRHVSIEYHRRRVRSFSRFYTLQRSFALQLHQYFQLYMRCLILNKIWYICLTLVLECVHFVILNQ